MCSLVREPNFPKLPVGFSGSSPPLRHDLTPAGSGDQLTDFDQLCVSLLVDDGELAVPHFRQMTTYIA